MAETEFLTVFEVAELCRVHPATVRNWLRAGSLPGRHIGQQWRVRREDLDRFLEGEVSDQQGVKEIASPAAAGGSSASGRSMSASASRAVVPRIIG